MTRFHLCGFFVVFCFSFSVLCFFFFVFSFFFWRLKISFRSIFSVFRLLCLCCVKSVTAVVVTSHDLSMRRSRAIFQGGCKGVRVSGCNRIYARS